MSAGNGTAVAKRNRIADLDVTADAKPVDPKAPKKEQVRISAPNIKTLRFYLVGTTPYLQCRFPVKAMNQIKAKQLRETTRGDAWRASQRTAPYCFAVLRTTRLALAGQSISGLAFLFIQSIQHPRDP